ncbi:unnamed protein product [Pocillopora meandrina]|uniref:Uncharacterized protein n=1 Tax=Pocillopora meandrina TaxID=46732 RepID=A0AAU9XUU4_9CNID|nr:unnamed protein product [Pocillopora meandrina]
MNKMKTKQITEPHELIDHLNDTTIEISDVRILSADVIELTYKKIEEDAVKGSKTNIFIAAFTTCQARLKLYESLEAQNILDEILDPQDERRDTDIVNPRHFKRDPIAKKIKTETQVKKYGLVFDKRVLYVGTFKSYPYVYAQFTGFDAQDILNIETLI